MHKKEKILVGFYIFSVVVSIYFIDTPSKIKIVATDVLQHLILGLLYFVSVPATKNNRNFYLLLSCLTLGDVFFTFSNLFIYAVIFYMIVYAYLLYSAYSKNLKGISFFKVFTFSIPFVFSYSILILLLGIWKDVFLLVFLMLTILLACALSSVVLLSYAYHKNLKNIYLFFGIYTLQFVNLLALMFHFDDKSIWFNVFIILFGHISQLLIVKSLILSDKEESNDYENDDQEDDW